MKISTDDSFVSAYRKKMGLKKHSETHEDKLCSVMSLVFIHITMMYHQTNKFREIAGEEWETWRKKQSKTRELSFKLIHVGDY